jgi:hypothetical protein
VVDGPDGVVAVLELVQAEDHLLLQHLEATDADLVRPLADFAEAAARGIGVRDIRLAADAMPADRAAALGYRDGVKRIRAAGHLESIGVPLWRDGTAALSQSLYYRGVWAALALLFGLGSISIVVFDGGELTWAHIAVPALLCATGSLFAVWQIFLVVKAGRRSGRRGLFAATAIAAATAVGLIGLTLRERALPALTELWDIYSGDAQLSDLDVTVSRDGRVLHVEGTYGVRSEDLVRRALAEHKSIREVVLAGPGGRVSVGFALFRMFRERKLATRVETGCASACTIAFLGGVERSLAPDGKLGFHRASFPGMGDNDMYESNRGIRRFLIYNARLTPAFAERVFDTPANSIWVPTPAELLAGKVINRVSP